YIVSPGTANERINYYYSDNDWSVSEAEQICTGTNTGKGNTFEIIEGTGAGPTTAVTTATTGGGGNGGSGGAGTTSGGGSAASCDSVCAQIKDSYEGENSTPCLEEYKAGQANADSCGELSLWQAMLDCCAAGDVTAFCEGADFDTCQKGLYKNKRPPGAKNGCLD
ncbi:hypothetical protein JYT22_00600, partial [Endomicrobium sp. AH-315-J14]|nr:hypothetical protein [Endomicrobium sp. AH-315-J14]